MMPLQRPGVIDEAADIIELRRRPLFGHFDEDDIRR